MFDSPCFADAMKAHPQSGVLTTAEPTRRPFSGPCRSPAIHASTVIARSALGKVRVCARAVEVVHPGAVSRHPDINGGRPSRLRARLSRREKRRSHRPDPAKRTPKSNPSAPHSPSDIAEIHDDPKPKRCAIASSCFRNTAESIPGHQHAQFAIQHVDGGDFSLRLAHSSDYEGVTVSRAHPSNPWVATNTPPEMAPTSATPENPLWLFN